MMHINLEKIKFLLPYVGSLVIFCGFVKLNIYYLYFNIDISDYLEISEIISLILSHVIRAIVIIFSVNLFRFLIDSDTEINERRNRKEAIFEIKSFYKRLWKYITDRIILPVILFILLTFSILSYYFNKSVFFTLIILFFYTLTLYISVYILLEYQRRYKEVYKTKLDATYSNLILLFIMFFVYTMQTTFSEIDKTKNRNTNFVCFNYLEQDIQSGRNILYVGQTKNFIFLYNNITEETKVYPRSEIKNFVISR